jgi:hypothetical protein
MSNFPTNYAVEVGVLRPLGRPVLEHESGLKAHKQPPLLLKLRLSIIIIQSYTKKSRDLPATLCPAWLKLESVLRPFLFSLPLVKSLDLKLLI